jgi:hypothetical protein
VESFEGWISVASQVWVGCWPNPRNSSSTSKSISWSSKRGLPDSGLFILCHVDMSVKPIESQALLLSAPSCGWICDDSEAPSPENSWARRQCSIKPFAVLNTVTPSPSGESTW